MKTKEKRKERKRTDKSLTGTHNIRSFSHSKYTDILLRNLIGNINKTKHK